MNVELLDSKSTIKSLEGHISVNSEELEGKEKEISRLLAEITDHQNAIG